MELRHTFYLLLPLIAAAAPELSGMYGPPGRFADPRFRLRLPYPDGPMRPRLLLPRPGYPPISMPAPQPAPPPPSPRPQVTSSAKKQQVPVSLEVIPIKETTAGVYQTKFKFYLKPYCPKGDAAVEFQNQQAEGVGRVKVVNVDTAETYNIPYHGTNGWSNLPRICFKDTNNPVYYKILVDNRPIAWFSCVTLPDDRMLTEIRGQDNKGSKYHHFSNEAGTGLKWNMGEYTIGLETVKESTGGVNQSKFKIYLQKNDWGSGFYDHGRWIASLCGGASAVVEFQNQEGSAPITVVQLPENRTFVIPAQGTTGYSSLGALCAGEWAYYRLIWQNQIIGYAKFVYGYNQQTGQGRYQAFILDPNGNTDRGWTGDLSPITGKHELRVTLTPDGRSLGIVVLKESGQDKFKMYFQHNWPDIRHYACPFCHNMFVQDLKLGNAH